MNRVAYILAAVDSGRISVREADMLLRAEYHTTYEEATHNSVAKDADRAHARRRNLGIAFAALLIALVGASYLFSNAPTGLATFTLTEDINGSSSYAITQPITDLRVSGTLRGEGTAVITYETADATHHVATITSDDGTPRTAAPSYTTGESVELEHAPADATYYLDDGETNTAVTIPFAAPAQTSDLLIVANESGVLTTYRLPIIIGTQERLTTFENLCDETCAMEQSTGTLHVEVSDGAYVTLNITGTAANVNTAPQLVIAYEPLTVSAPTVLELGNHFTDADGDTLLYTTSGSTLATLSLDGTQLSITPTRSGTEEITIYASDLHELVPATLTLTTVVTEQTSENQTNETIIEEPVEEPVTEPIVESNITEPALNESEITSNVTLDCTNPDPNARPLDCVVNQSTAYFEEDVYIENVNRERVARITPIGNLVITGELITAGDINPEPDDFSIGYRDENFNYVPTLWIDDSGNLHVQGSVVEENTHLEPTEGSYTVRNARGIYLLYADKQHGHLYLRGNLITGRRSVTP